MPQPKGLLHKLVVKQSLNRIVKLVFKANPDEHPQILLSLIYQDLKYLDGFTMQYLFDNLDRKNKKMIRKRMEQFKDKIQSP